MLYPTHHHHFLFKFNPFPHFPPSSHFQGMEPVQGGFGPDTAAEVGAAAGDDFFVDELLDFSNGDTETEQQEMEEKHEVETEKIKTNAVSQEKQEAASPPEKSCFSGEDGLVSFHESDMSVEGLESLEWLSHFVEDSFSDYSLTGKVPPESKPEAAGKVEEQPCFTTPVQTKARTKRARAGVRVWPVLSSSLTEPSTSSSSSTSSTTSFQAEEAPAKRQKRKPAEGGGGVAAQPRRCSHCGVTKTPQWRAGPLGSKTLCNACGVRYKSGRLLPEYRPACSPTFSSELHSNNHRKVLEMRRKKETEMAAAGLPPPVQSF